MEISIRFYLPKFIFNLFEFSIKTRVAVETSLAADKQSSTAAECVRKRAQSHREARKMNCGCDIMGRKGDNTFCRSRIVACACIFRRMNLKWNGKSSEEISVSFPAVNCRWNGRNGKRFAQQVSKLYIWHASRAALALVTFPPEKKPEEKKCSVA